MRYTYEFELFPCEGWVLATPFDFEGGTQGVDVAEASAMAADWLQGEIRHLLMTNQSLPAPTFGNTPSQPDGRVLIVSVEATLDDIDAVSASEAASMLDVSRARVSQMLKSGQLQGWNVGRSVFVTSASIEARLEERPSPGRPRKLPSLSKAAAL